ncbi:3-(3-hydroxy-phenyl)propionate/3-hydroxycinnamic acid hydroxylase [Methanimicrococcus sp. At1]|uniref:3-(3-hydroxy-phenyl)propionate/3-hydroxycinnamic acid hydroxylase n=1 Tax=Methanimicrococcus hacksteinii TaxID=3028293 RepID=A0ABU3VPQ3_9EURY|nr:NAD(P)/FAD-dependent oxidoreductase [Methanimicrococcus sp. At1]MDV0444880.1 3-(3-hydroxy-phenyl)propionate/3-hydroxycinnamic acid hydroxylase [Methanimicrococcus sp. At1]
MSFPLSKKNFDVVVVGAGPAGSMAAKYAALGGVDVLFIDRKREIGTPVQCAGFTPEASEIENLIPGMTLPREMKKIPKHCIRAKTKTQRLYSPDLKIKEFDVSGYVLDRHLFDAELAEQATFEGAELLCGTSVRSVLSGSTKYTVRLSGVFGKTDVTTKVIIGADGPSSFIGKTFGLTHGGGDESDSDAAPNPAGYERGIGFEYRMTDVDIDTDSLEMFFGNKYVPGGYIWIFPEGEGKANVGIGLRHSLCTENLSARDFLNRFMQEHPIAAEKLKGGKIVSVHGGVIPVSGAPSRTATNSVMVAGDAAGHVMATNGGGIPFAAAAGKIAGDVAAEAVLDEKCGRGLSVASYEQRWRSEFGDALDASVQARKLMDKFLVSDKRINAAFRLLPADKLKEMQCGNISPSVKKGLSLLLK